MFSRRFRKNKGVYADMLALPFWLILLVYGIYEVSRGNNLAWIVLVIIGAAFIIDFKLVLEYIRYKK